MRFVAHLMLNSERNMKQTLSPWPRDCSSSLGELSSMAETGIFTGNQGHSATSLHFHLRSTSPSRSRPSVAANVCVYASTDPLASSNHLLDISIALGCSDPSTTLVIRDYRLPALFEKSAREAKQRIECLIRGSVVVRAKEDSHLVIIL